MADVTECLYNKECNGQVVIDDKIKTALDAYYWSEHTARKERVKAGGSCNMERVYKTMKVTGAGCIAAGVVILVTGLVVGIISIVNGALLLKRKSEIEF